MFLRDLTEFATQERFVYAHVWRVNDLVVWDNRTTMHRARRFDRVEIRDVRRTTLAGDVATIEQVGANVVATGSGEFNLTGLTSSESGSSLTPDVDAHFPELVFSTGSYILYDVEGVTGPSNFGSGGTTAASSSSGPAVAFGLAFSSDLILPTGYTSGTVLATSTDTFDSTTLALLGINVGTYEWTWGAAADQSFTIDVVATPLPAAFSLFATGLGGLGLFGWRRKRKVQTLAA